MQGAGWAYAGLLDPLNSVCLPICGRMPFAFAIQHCTTNAPKNYREFRICALSFTKMRRRTTARAVRIACPCLRRCHGACHSTRAPLAETKRSAGRPAARDSQRKAPAARSIASLTLAGLAKPGRLGFVRVPRRGVLAARRYCFELGCRLVLPGFVVFFGEP